MRLPLDGVAGDAELLEVVGAGLGLGEPVALLAAAGDDDERGDAVARRARRRGRAGRRAPATASPSYCAAPSTTMASAGRGLVAARGPPHLDERDDEVQHDDGGDDGRDRRPGGTGPPLTRERPRRDHASRGPRLLQPVEGRARGRGRPPTRTAAGRPSGRSAPPAPGPGPWPAAARPRR